MTEINVQTDALPGPVERFVLHWGEMGTSWGVNRSVAQIHALLYLSETPLTAEDIADRLGMARSNVSTSLRELLCVEPHPPRARHGRPARLLRGGGRHVRDGPAHRAGPQGARDRSGARRAAQLRRRGQGRCRGAAERAQAAHRHARLHRDRRPQLRRDHAAAGADADGPYPHGRRDRALCRTQEQQEAPRAARSA